VTRGSLRVAAARHHRGARVTALYIIIGAIVVLVIWAVAIYNKLIRNRNQVQEGWSGIDVQLKRRSNLIPNLVETVKGYAGHERGVFEEVTELRGQTMSADTVADRAKAEGLLGAALGRLMMVAEAYPDLKASTNFQDLSGALEDMEEQIQLARRYYNGAVRNLNIAIESFPSNLIAGTFNFKLAEFFELDDTADRAVPKVSFEN
jgi:LemA protein